MNRCRTLHAAEHPSAGYSLIEVVVAISLVVTVLLPLVGAGVYLLTVRQNRPYLQALAIAQQTMEETLQARRYTGAQFEVEGRWEVRQTVTRTGGRVNIVVRVFRERRSRPLAVLVTVRLQE